MIKVYLFKEDPPFFNLNVWPMSIGLTKRNIIYVTLFAWLPALLLFFSLLWAGNILFFAILTVIMLIVWYVLSIFRIENVPIDRYMLNKLIFRRKKEKNENYDQAIDFSRGRKFDDAIKSKIQSLLQSPKNSR